MDPTAGNSTRRATLPVWGMVVVSLLVSVLMLAAFAIPVLRAGGYLSEVNDLRDASRRVDNAFGRYVQAVNE
ncbi:MAG TPA: hypothetical protein VHC70_11935, partial [Phycisphaerales bacterium]|nr:hypothetical protein [Phycisphaerales bacterium]